MTTTTNDSGEGQVPSVATPGEGGTPTPENVDTVDVEEFRRLKAEHATMAAALEKRNAENKERREAAQAAEAEKLKALEAKGEYEEASKMKDAKIAELEALQPRAERWDAFEAKQREQVEEALKADDLPDYIRTAVGATADPLAQMSILQGYRAHGAANTPAPTKPAGGGGGGGGGIADGVLDFSTMDDATKRKAIQDHPDKWRAHLEKQNGKRRKLSV